jgi:sodium-dependent dicarboxylate transporter 2/3/5
MTSQQLGISPVAPVIATGLAASMGFLMPISTAPNAIVYGTGRVPLATMAKTGAMIDLCGMIVIPPTVLWVTKLVGLR